MASTRNRNSAGDYAQEQHEMLRIRQYDMYAGRVNHMIPCLPGDGLGTAGKMPRETMASNACDIESYLMGVRATDLVNPSTGPTIPQSSIPASLSIIDRIPIMLPDPIAVPKYQRPYP
jgi:hypothetical protein